MVTIHSGVFLRICLLYSQTKHCINLKISVQKKTINQEKLFKSKKRKMSNSSEELYHKYPFPFPLFGRGRLGKGGNWKNIKETNDYSNLNLVFIDG